MKVIQIAGFANSGKTTFICKLVPALKLYGKVGVIKHMGDHDFLLEDGKDTTLFFESGADISAGIDASKSVVMLPTVDLEGMLRLFEQQDIEFAVIEGFKKLTFPKIIIGDLPDETCILRNPTIGEVISALPRFEDY